MVDARTVSVTVVAEDPLSRAGVTSQLRSVQTLRLVEASVDAEVALVVADACGEQTQQTLRSLRSIGCRRAVLVVTELDDGGLFAAVEAGACGILRRSEATPERLVQAVEAAAAGDGCLPPDLLGRLLEQVQRLQRQVLAPRGLTLSGLSQRETDVLRLLADGYDTAEIARTLSWSERTVKNIVHDVTTRLQLKNRAHAVAYAMREGLI
jgi:DNA-binding NarL/FixJ family response regulator